MSRRPSCGVWRGRVILAGIVLAVLTAWSPELNAQTKLSAPDISGKKPGEVRSFTELHLRMCWCPAGSFVMGSPESDDERLPDEDQVRVILSRGFWMGETEVTQEVWRRVMQSAPWVGKEYVQDAPTHPAALISWDEANDFCLRLTSRERSEGRLPEGWEYRLPTEAEWEYACRAGTRGPFGFRVGAASLSDYAWFEDNARVINEPYGHPVKTKKPNLWGLYDMHGNVWEWCLDRYNSELPGGRDPVKRDGWGAREWHVLRGGSWCDCAELCRSAARHSAAKNDRTAGLGFRVVLGSSISP